MEVVRKRIAALKDELDEKDGIIEELNARLKQEEEKKSFVEIENQSLSNKLITYQKDLDMASEKLEKSLVEISFYEKEREENEQALRSVTDKEQTVSDQLDAQFDELKEAKQIAEEADKKYDEVDRKLKMLKIEVERNETKANEFNLENEQLLEDLRHLNAEVDSFKAQEDDMNDIETRQEILIADLTRKLDESQKAKEEAEQECKKLQKDIEDNEAAGDKLVLETQKYKGELETMINDLSAL